MTHLGSLSDEELVSRVRTNLTASAMEKEIARRLADAIDQLEAVPAEIKELRDRIEDLEREIYNLENME